MICTCTMAPKHAVWCPMFATTDAAGGTSEPIDSELWDALEALALARHRISAREGTIVSKYAEDAKQLTDAHTRIVDLFRLRAATAAEPITDERQDLALVDALDAAASKYDGTESNPAGAVVRARRALLDHMARLRTATAGAARDAERLQLAEMILGNFREVPCLRALLGEDSEGCECMGCASRAYFRAARTPTPDSP